MANTQKVLLTAVLLALSGLGFNAQAVIAINDYTLNFSDAGKALALSRGETDPALVNLTGVDEWNIFAQAVVGFQDVDTSGNISPGDKFEDFVNIRVTGFTDVGANDITPATYGTQTGDKFELTAQAQFTGKQTGNNTYSVDATDFVFDVFFDADTGTTANTPSNFSVAGTFSDGINVETGVLVAGGGVNDTPVLPDGTIDLVVALIDLLSFNSCSIDPFAFCGPLELDSDEQPFEIAFPFLLGLVDANNNLLYQSGGAVPSIPNDNFIKALETDFTDLDCSGDLAACAGTINGGADFDFYFLTRSDGSFNKATVPEPTTLLLMGIGLLALGVRARSRKS